MHNFDFVGKKKIFFIVSAVILALTILFSFVFGVNLDIQFKGGSLVTYSYTDTLDHDAFQDAFEEAVGGKIALQESINAATGEKNIQVSLSEARGISPEQLEDISAALDAQFPDTQITMTSVSSVDPTIGSEFLSKCLIAVVFAFILMIVYVAIRFRVIGGWSAGVMAVIALAHDVMIIFAVFVIFRIPINDNFIAVVLTILGYSLNDTIVIYDRIRENKRLYGDKMNLRDLVNKSLNQSMGRTLATTVTTVTAMVVVLIVAVVFNVNTIVFFAFPLIMGMLSGFYSSVCLSSTLWITWQEHKAAKKQLKK